MFRLMFHFLVENLRGSRSSHNFRKDRNLSASSDAFVSHTAYLALTISKLKIADFRQTSSKDASFPKCFSKSSVYAKRLAGGTQEAKLSISHREEHTEK